MIKIARPFAVILLAALLFTPAANALDQKTFEAWLLTDLWPRAKSAGISQATFQKAVHGLRPDPTMPDLAGAQSGKQRQSEFRAPARYFPEKTLKAQATVGRERVRKWKSVLNRIERRTGVPGSIIVAIWARESGFGRVKMPKNAIRSLATLAFAGRRKALFEKELIAALKIVDAGHISAADMGSSWAGALGQPQFLPSKFFAHAVDEDGDGKADIWNSVPDTLGSIGEYLAHHGWQRGRDWGFEAVIPASVSCAIGGPDTDRTIADWAKSGVTRVAGRAFPAHELKGKGFLLFPGGRTGPAFVTTPNFYVLKKYNESDVYALYVGHLADRIRGAGPFKTKWQSLPTLRRDEVKKMQERLIAKGYDVGGADGLIGYKSRTAIGKWQESVGRNATCWPTRETVQNLR